MKNYSNYKKHIEVDMVKYSGDFHFKEQLKQEGTDIKINEKSTQLIDSVDTNIRAIVRNSGVENKEANEERSIMIGKEYDYKVHSHNNQTNWYTYSSPFTAFYFQLGRSHNIGNIAWNKHSTANEKPH
jgi:hypothetical protein